MRKRKLKWKHITGILKWMLTLIPAYIAKLFIKNIWLVNEDDNEARDNGYHLFKYIRLYHPTQPCYYVINKKSPDYNKVSCLGKTIQPNSFSHWFWYIVASKNISTQTAGKPCAAFTKTMEKKGIFKTKTYFLQHGITCNDMPSLYYKNVKFKLFLTSAKPEHDYVEKRFGYPKGVVQYLGFPRFDNLHENIVDEKMILVMPTWRTYIKGSRTSLKDKDGVEEQEFTESEYFIGWHNFLNSKEVNEFLEKNDMHILFYPHRLMQPYIDNFSTTSDRIKIAKEATNDIQTLLKSCRLLITDFSSVFFDVAYQRKPVIAYQFDEETFRKGHHPKGYLDYHKTPLLKQTKTLEGVMEYLEEFKKNDFKLNKKALAEIDKFFPLYDKKNCERVYNFIKKH